MTNQKLLISTVYKRKFIRILPIKYPKQLKPFHLGLKIKNIGNKASSGGTIKSLELHSSEGDSIYDVFHEELSFKKLNPNEEEIVWWPEPFTTVLSGKCWIECRVVPDSKEVKFSTYQDPPHSIKPIAYSKTNHWGDGLVVISRIEAQQSRTNTLMFLLTLLMFLDGVWGLDFIVKKSLMNCAAVFNWLGRLLTSIAN